MPFVERRGVPIHWEARGPEDGPAILLVMGLGLSSRAWDTLPDALAAHHRVLTFDNRWTGRSRPEDARRAGWGAWVFGIGDLADDAAAVLGAALGPSRRAAVFGVSMGGMIAQELALRHPGRVSALALGCTLANYWRGAKPNLSVALDLLLSTTLPTPERSARLVEHLVSAEFLAREPAKLQRWLIKGGFAGPQAALAQLAAVQRHDTRARLRALEAPTLVITGDADRLVPPSNSHQLAALIPGARLELLPGAGHVFPLERERDTVDHLLRHFTAARAR